MTTAVIAYSPNARYAANTMPKKSDTTAEERAALEERAKAGEWLRVGDAAKVLDIGRTKMHTLVTKGLIGYRTEPGSRYRLCNPKDVVKLLDESRLEMRGDAHTVRVPHHDTSRTPAAVVDRADPETAPTTAGDGTHRR